MSNLILPMFLLMMVTSGMAIDLVEQETNRADAWNAADRAMLAATSLTQTGDPQTIIREYLEKRPYADFADSCEDPVVESRANTSFREFTISYNCTMNTAFARLAGQPEFPIPVVSGAIEGVDAVEISMVLDISGSMAANDTADSTDKRLEALREAAGVFVDEVLSDVNSQNISISVIPYSGQVNAAPFFDRMIDPNGRDHNRSSCIDFLDEDFVSSALPDANSRDQTPVFQWFTYEGPASEGGRGHEAAWGWCPTDQQAILPFTNNQEKLVKKFQDFVAHDGTGTQNGMKWGLALLDPSTRPIIASLAADGIADAEFSDRPRAFGLPEVQKIVVLMTDGNIRYQNRPLPAVLANGADTGSPTERAYWEVPRTFIYRGRRYLSNVMHTQWSSQGIDNPAYTVEPDFGILDNTDEPLRVSQFGQMCDVAKANGIRVFTIGFDISETSDAYNEMRNCASSVADFYFAEGKVELVAAFKQIAVLTQRLRLIR